MVEEQPHISNSQLEMFLRCGMQYYFAYILKMKRRPNLAMKIGSGGHETLEWNGHYKIKHGEDAPMEAVLDVASTFIDAQTSELEPSDFQGKDKGDAKDRAIKAIAIYRQRDAPRIFPAGVEVGFDLDLNEPNEEPIRIVNGRIDLITTDMKVIDFKFAGRMKSQADADLSTQLSLYGKVVKTLTGKYPKATGLQVFTPGNTRASPDAQLLLRTAELMTPAAQESRWARLAHQFRMVEKSIKAGIFVPTDNPIVCSWCGYRDRCQSSLVSDYEAIKLRGETA